MIMGDIIFWLCGRSNDSDISHMFIARANMEGVVTPGKFGYHLHGDHIPYGGKEQIVNQYDNL